MGCCWWREVCSNVTSGAGGVWEGAVKGGGGGTLLMLGLGGVLDIGREG